MIRAPELFVPRNYHYMSTKNGSPPTYQVYEPIDADVDMEVASNEMIPRAPRSESAWPGQNEGQYDFIACPKGS